MVVLARKVLKKVAKDFFVLGIKNPQVMDAVQGDEAFFHILHFILALEFHLERSGEVKVGEVFSFTQQPPDQPIRICLQQASHPGVRLPEIQPVFFPQLKIE